MAWSGDAWDYYKNHLGAPKYGVAPMVDGSELPFRMMCRKYGATMAWTPMFHRLDLLLIIFDRFITEINWL